MLFIPTHLVVLSTLAVETALVIDIGNKEATIIPVYCGVQVLHAWQAQAIAAEAVHDDIKKQLIESGIDQELLSPEIIEDIKGKFSISNWSFEFRVKSQSSFSIRIFVD